MILWTLFCQFCFLGVTLQQPKAIDHGQHSIVGYSVEHRPIETWSFGTASSVLLVMGGTHGDEPSSTGIVRKLMGYCSAHPETLAKHRIVFMPLFNPDGAVRHTRTNAHKIDINRNFPAGWKTGERGRYFPGTKPQSEPETRLMMALLDNLRPASILTIHAPLACLNWDGPGAKEPAEHMALLAKYPCRSSIGYPTPGSLGKYGIVHGIPVITLELGYEPMAKTWKRNLPGFLYYFSR